MPAPKDKKLGRAAQGEGRKLRSSKGEGHKERNGADRQADPIDKKRPLILEKATRREQAEADGPVLKRIRQAKTIVILLFSLTSKHSQVGIILELCAGMPVRVGILLLHEVLLEHLQLAGVGQQRLHAQDRHLVVLLGLLLALGEGLLAHLQRDAQVQLEGNLLENGRIAVVLVVEVNVPQDGILVREPLN